MPAHWQLHGHGSRAYPNLAYPFPVGPPRVPLQNPTGEYRRWVELCEQMVIAVAGYLVPTGRGRIERG